LGCSGGELTSETAATELRDQLRAAGYTAFIQQARVAVRSIIGIRVGPESDRHHIEQIASQLRQRVGGQPLIQRYQ
jgi:DedD protein